MCFTLANVSYLQVLVVPLLDSLKGQPPPRRAWIAAALATLGVAVLELGDCGGTLESLTRDDWLSLLQPIGFGLGFWRMEAFGHKFPRDALPLAAGQVAGVALAASAWAMYEFGCMDAASGAEGWSIAAEGLRAAVHDIEVAPSGTAAVLITLAWTGLASTAATVNINASFIRLSISCKLLSYNITLSSLLLFSILEVNCDILQMNLRGRALTGSSIRFLFLGTWGVDCPHSAFGSRGDAYI